jgi:cellulose synthase/poly-beta-1,6-N-acetylglucosamine synthase-like glycosyltransferase
MLGGMAPDDLEPALTQRLRWAMGALQVRRDTFKVENV